MNAGTLPLGLLCAAVGIALSLTPRRSAWTAFAAMLGTALAIAAFPISSEGESTLLAALWLSTIATAALAYFPSELPSAVGIAVAVNGGLWVGALAGSSELYELAYALPFGLIFLPGRFFSAGRYAIIIRVVASWVITIAALAFMVSMMTAPGYVPDHMG